MAAKNVDGVAADAHARAEDEPSVNRSANRRIGGARALCAHVAFGRESGKKICFGGLLGKDYSPRNGFLYRLQILSARMQKQVHMCVDETGQQSRVAQVDETGALWVFDRGAYRANPISLNEDFTRLEQVSGVHMEQPRGVQHNRCGFRWLRRNEFDRRKVRQREGKSSTKAKERKSLN
jgi:hypothetical protein